jgi:hypothetical protein
MPSKILLLILDESVSSTSYTYLPADKADVVALFMDNVSDPVLLANRVPKATEVDDVYVLRICAAALMPDKSN